MEDGSVSGLIAIFVLIGLHALLTLAYAAIVNARVRELTEEGDLRALSVMGMVASANFTVTVQLITTLIRFAVAGIAIVKIADRFISTNPAINPLPVYTLVLFVTVCVMLILGDIVPEAIGSSHATMIALTAVGPMKRLSQLFSPVVFVILKISTWLSRLFKSDNFVNTVTEEEIISLIDAGHTGGTIEEEEREMIYSVLQLDQTRVSEMMVPRIDIIAVEIEQSLEEAALIFVESGYSRIPVYEDSIDNIRGLLYAKDLLVKRTAEANTSIRDLIRPVYFVPESKRADELLKEIQQQKVHLAIVVDEYGGTAGLVTIENIIEEIIGDIQDEYDLNEEADYEQTGPDEYTVDASIDLDDFNELLDVDLPTEDSDTLGGYIYTHFGRIPLEGETIEGEELVMNVLSVDGRRIRKVHVIRKHPETMGDAAMNTDENESTEMSKAG